MDCFRYMAWWWGFPLDCLGVVNGLRFIMVGYDPGSDLIQKLTITYALKHFEQDLLKQG